MEPFQLSSLHDQHSAPFSLIQRVDYFRKGGGKSSSDELTDGCSQQSPGRLDTPGVRQAPHTTQRFGCSQRAQLASYINDLRAAPPRPPAQAADALRPNPPSPGQTSPNQHVGFFPRQSWGTQ